MSTLKIVLSGKGDDLPGITETLARARKAGLSVSSQRRIYTPVPLSSDELQQQLFDHVSPMLWSDLPSVMKHLRSVLAQLGLETVSDLTQLRWTTFALQYQRLNRGIGWVMEGYILEFMLDHGLCFPDADPRQILRTPIEEVELPMPLRNSLINRGMRWLDLFQFITFKQLQDLRGIGFAYAKVVTDLVASADMQFRE